MTLSRRKTLRILGGGLVLAAGAVAADLSTGPAKALAPWRQAGSYKDPRLDALSYAILSPNPHNRQSWLIDLSAADEVTLYVDLEKLLPHTDPFSRQITIGLGCFLETLRMAAAQRGLMTEFDLFPDGEDAKELDQRRVAVVKFAPGAQPDPLFAHVMKRRTQKDPYDLSRDVSDGVLAELEAACLNGTRPGTTNQGQRVAELRQLSRDALIVEVETPHTFKESVDLFRIGRKEVNENPDGIDFSGPLFQGLHRAGLMTREGTLNPQSTMFEQGLAAVLENADTAMAHIWLVTEVNDRSAQINAGRDWMRVNLAATGLGVAMQPLSQALQEYPEMAVHYSKVHKMLAQDGGTVQMMARLGYCDAVPESPRWPIEKKLLNG